MQKPKPRKPQKQPLDDAHVFAALEEQQQPDISAATRSTYASSLKRVRSLTTTTLYRAYMRPQATYATLDAALRPRSIYTLLITVTGFVTAMKRSLRPPPSPAEARADAQWTQLRSALSKDVERLRESGEAYGRQVKASLTWAQVVENNDRLREEARRRPLSSEKSMDALLSAFYVDLPPRRQADYHRVFIVRGRGDLSAAEREPAFVDLTAPEPYITVKRFKTAKSHGPWTRTLPATLRDALLASLKQEHKRKYVFCGSDGQPFASVNAFTKAHNRRIKAWFGPHATNNSLRHAMATQAMQDPTLSLGERRAIAKDMGQGLETHMTYAVVGKPREDELRLQSFMDGKMREFVCRPVSS
jgi:integrase